MAPSPNLIVPPSIITTLRAPNLPSTIYSSSPVILATYKGSTTLPSTVRRFWWGRNGYRGKAVCGTASYHKCLEAQNRIAKYKAAKASVSPSRPSFPFYYYRGKGWRLASSWGKSDKDSNHVPSDKGKAEMETEQNSKSELDKWQEEFHARIERLRERVENQPYEMLFGASAKNRVWNPWDHDAWSNWMRSLGLAEWEKSNSLTQKPEPMKQRSWNGTVQANSKSPSAESKPSSTSFCMKDSGSEVGDIDLITLRRVPKQTVDRTSTENGSSSNTEFHIPVKTFNPSSSASYLPSNTPKHESASAELRPQTAVSSESQSPTVIQLQYLMERTANSPNTWLAREGFSENSENPSKPESNDQAIRRSGSTNTNKNAAKLESALERHIRTAPPLSQSDASACSVKYLPKEDRTDDVDLLRASTIRASSGRLKRPAQEPAENRQARRENLRVTFEKRQQDLEAQYKNELAAETDDALQVTKLENTEAESGIEDRRTIQTVEKDNALSDQQLNLNKLGTEDKPPANVDAWGYDLTPQGLETSYQDELDNKVQNLEAQYVRRQEELMEAERQRSRRIATDAALVEEIEKQKTAMAALENRTCCRQQGKPSLDLGEGDVSSSVHQFAGQDRWYKRKAPHALQHEAQKAKDAALVSEIRDIYEERYGKIEIKHRQRSRHPGMEDREDPAVQEGLYAYDEKSNADDSVLGTKGKIAATDLDSHEIASLAGSATPLSSSLTLETNARSKSSSQPQKSIEGLTREEGQTRMMRTLSNDTDKDLQSLETGVVRNIEQVNTLSQDCISSMRNAIGKSVDNSEEGLHSTKTRAEVKVLEITALVDKQIEQPPAATTRSISSQIDEQSSVQWTQAPSASISTSRLKEEKIEATNIPVTIKYKVLAYDQAKDVVATATTTSSLYESSTPPRSASSILSHLDNPVRYFDHFEPLEAAGYELVAGSRKMLVFKKVRDDDPTNTKSMQATISRFLRAQSSVQDLSNCEEDAVSSLKPKFEAQKDRLVDNNVTSAFGSPDIVSYTKVQGPYDSSESDTKPVTELSEITRDKEPTAPTDQAVPSISAEAAIKTTNSDNSSTSSANTSPYLPTSPNPIDGTLASDPAAASNTVSQPPSSSPSSQPVHRQEPLFSGRNVTPAQYKERRRQLRLAAQRFREQQNGSKRSEMWKNAKRMMWTGAWVATCLYLVGALLEEVYRPRRERERD